MESHRRQFESHPGFPQQALLLDSHDSFLAAGREFETRVEAILSGKALSPRQQARFLLRLPDEFRQWQWTMGCHETFEEGRLYPFLNERFGLDPRGMIASHEQLHAIADNVVVALDSIARNSGSDEAQIRQALAVYRQALAEHLADEELRVVPLLLAMSPEEFGAWSRQGSCESRAPDSSTP